MISEKITKIKFLILFYTNILDTIFTYWISEIHKRGDKNDIFNQRFRLSCMTWNFKSRNLQVKLKGRADGNPLIKIAGWDFRMEIYITPTR